MAHLAHPRPRLVVKDPIYSITATPPAPSIFGYESDWYPLSMGTARCVHEVYLQRWQRDCRKLPLDDEMPRDEWSMQGKDLSSIKKEISIGLCTWRSYWCFVASIFARRLALQRSLISECWQPNLERSGRSWALQKHVDKLTFLNVCQAGCDLVCVWYPNSAPKTGAKGRLASFKVKQSLRQWKWNERNWHGAPNTLPILFSEKPPNVCLKIKEEFHCLLKSFK